MITIDGGTGTILHNGVKFNKESDKVVDEFRTCLLYTSDAADES